MDENRLKYSYQIQSKIRMERIVNEFIAYSLIAAWTEQY